MELLCPFNQVFLEYRIMLFFIVANSNWPTWKLERYHSKLILYRFAYNYNGCKEWSKLTRYKVLIRDTRAYVHIPVSLVSFVLDKCSIHPYETFQTNIHTVDVEVKKTASADRVHCQLTNISHYK